MAEDQVAVAPASRHGGAACHALGQAGADIAGAAWGVGRTHQHGDTVQYDTKWRLYTVVTSCKLSIITIIHIIRTACDSGID